MATGVHRPGVLFGRYLWVTNTATGGLFAAVGDVLQQTAQQARAGANKKIKHDWHRTGRMLVVGLSLGLPQHCWYTWLDRILPGVSMLKVTKKIFLDQLILAPVVLCSFFMVSGLLERHSLQQSWKEVQNKFAMVYKIDCAVWPPLQLINFLYVSPTYRVLYVNTTNVAWNIFLSYAKHFDETMNIRPS